MSGVESGFEPAELSAALRESEERLRLIQAVAQIGSFDWDMRSGRIYRSPEYLALHGLPADSDTRSGFSDQWLDRVHPEDRAQVEAWFRDDVAAPSQFAREYRILRADTGELRWLYNRGRVESDADGRPVRMISAQTDITGRKLGELRSRFIAGLVEALRGATTARDAMAAASEHIGRSLGVSLVGFGEVDESEAWADVRADWSNGELPSRIGRHRLTEFGPELHGWLKSGQPLVIEDADALLQTFGAGWSERSRRSGPRPRWTCRSCVMASWSRSWPSIMRRRADGPRMRSTWPRSRPSGRATRSNARGRRMRCARAKSGCGLRSSAPALAITIWT